VRFTELRSMCWINDSAAQPVPRTTIRCFLHNHKRKQEITMSSNTNDFQKIEYF
jgi:hypothetical protein